MSRRLIITNTYFQLITAINLKLSKFEGDSVDIFVTDCSSDSQNVVNRLRTLNVFDNVFEVYTKNVIQTKTVRDKMKRFIQFNFYKEGLFSNLIPEISYDYDELLFYNYDSFVTYIFKQIKKLNKSAKWSRFEEGYISYFYGNIDSRIVRFSEFHNNLLNKDSMKKNANKYYFYEPEFIMFDNFDYHIEEIPKISRNNEEFKSIVNKIFGVDQLGDEYNTKFIFFEESFFCDNKGVEDFDLIMRIVECVGKENIMIKLHPRNPVDRFSKHGIKTNKTIGIPWEVIQLNNDFANSVFLTISSGSVLSSRILFGDKIKTYLLYNCTEKKSPLVNEKYMEYLKSITNKYGMDGLVIPNDINELCEEIGNEKL